MADHAVEVQEAMSVPSTHNVLVEDHIRHETPTVNESINRTDKTHEDDSTDSISHSTTGSSLQNSSSHFIGCCKSSQYSTSDKHPESKNRTSLKCRCMLMSFGVILFLSLLCTVVILSILLHFEKQDSKLLVNELYSKQELLKCFKSRADANLCPSRSVAALLRCDTEKVTEIRAICNLP